MEWSSANKEVGRLPDDRYAQHVSDMSMATYGPWELYPARGATVKIWL